MRKAKQAEDDPLWDVNYENELPRHVGTINSLDVEDPPEGFKPLFVAGFTRPLTEKENEE